MQILQNMDPDKMVIVFPTALLAMYFIVSLQKSLCEKQNPLIGLILPVICFVARRSWHSGHCWLRTPVSMKGWASSVSECG